MNTRNRGRGCDPGCRWTSVVGSVDRLGKGDLDWIVGRTSWTSPGAVDSSWVTKGISVWTRGVFTLGPTSYSPVTIRRVVKIETVIEPFTLERIGRVSGRHDVYLDRRKHQSVYKRKVAAVGDLRDVLNNGL